MRAKIIHRLDLENYIKLSNISDLHHMCGQKLYDDWISVCDWIREKSYAPKYARPHHRPFLSRRDCSSYRHTSQSQKLSTAVLVTVASRIPPIKQNDPIRAQALVSFNEFRNVPFIRSSCCGGAWRQNRAFIHRCCAHSSMRYRTPQTISVNRRTFAKKKLIYILVIKFKVFISRVAAECDRVG